MRSVLFLVGLVLGFLGGVGTIIYLQQRNKDTGEIAGREMSIVFAKKNYYETPDMVTVSGTLRGPRLSEQYLQHCLLPRSQRMLDDIRRSDRWPADRQDGFAVCIRYPQVVTVRGDRRRRWNVRMLQDHDHD
jgi:hypothetical protein